MGVKVRHQIRLPQDLRAGVAAYAQQRGMRFAPAVRALVVEGLRWTDDPTGSEANTASTVAFAALIAAEQTGLMVASILPGGEEKWLAMAAKAAERAAERLAIVEQSLAVARDV